LPEPVTSKLGNEGALRIHVLASIAGDYVHDINETFEFHFPNFSGLPAQSGQLIELRLTFLNSCKRKALSKKNGFRYLPHLSANAPAGFILTRCPPIILRNGLKRLNLENLFSNIGLLQSDLLLPGQPVIELRQATSKI